MIRVAFGSVPKDSGTFTFYRNMRPALRAHGIDLRCVTVGRDQASLTDPAFADEGCVLLAARTASLKAQAREFAAWCATERIDAVFGVNSPAILSALPHLPTEIRALARCANGFEEGYRLTLVGQERLARIVALTPRLQADLVTDYGVSPDRIVLIPNGVPPERFAAAARTARGRNAVVKLGFLGRLEHRQKGVLHLPAILRHLQEAGVPFQVRIAGQGKDEAALRSALGDLHLPSGAVRFLGSLRPDEIPGFLAETDIFLFPSHFEGCPNALLEAMAAGAVPVAWLLPGLTDFLIDPGTTGFLADTGDTAALARRIAALARDPARLQAMSWAVSRAARDRFSRDRCVQAYAELFDSVMAEPPPAWQPVPWHRFAPPTLFRQHPLARILPARQRKALRGLLHGLRRRPQPMQQQQRPQTSPPPPPPRVFQIINSIDLKRGGAERMARSLHGQLQSEGIEAHLVSLEAFGVGEVPAGAVSLGVNSPYDPRALARLAAYARQHIRPSDIVHAHLFPASLYLSLLVRLGGLEAPVLFTEHSTSNNRRASLVGRVIDRQVYGAFKQIIAISQGVRAELQKARPWVQGVTVIPNGCRLVFDRPIRRAPKSEPLTLLSVGRLTPAKNYETALAAVAQLMPCNLRYVIAGDGQELEALRRTAERLGLADVVDFAGYVPDVSALLQEADIFLIPSLWEGFGLAAVEGMNAALPVIAADVAGLREVVGPDGQAALLVDPQEPASIAAAIRRLAESADLRRQLGQNGFARSQSFRLEDFVSAHLNLYAKVRHGYGL